MPRLTIGWCRNCGHKIALHPRRPEWHHFAVNQGYVLSVTCTGSETGASLRPGAGDRGDFGSSCDCVQAAPDDMFALQRKWFLQ